MVFQVEDVKKVSNLVKTKVKDGNWRTKSGHLLSGEVRKNDTTPILRPGVCFREAGGEERGGGGQQETVTCQHLRTIRF